MHVISRKALRIFWQRHPDAKAPLLRWYQVMSRTIFSSFAQLRTSFPTADKVGRFIVFDIGGNKYRLIACVHFNRGKVYVRHVLTHGDYDAGAWKS